MSVLLFWLSQTCCLTQSNIMGTIYEKSKLCSRQNAVYSYVQRIVYVCQVFMLEKMRRYLKKVQSCSGKRKAGETKEMIQKCRCGPFKLDSETLFKLSEKKRVHARVQGFIKSHKVIDCSSRGNLCGIFFFFFSACRNRKNTHGPFSAIEPLGGEGLRVWG